MGLSTDRQAIEASSPIPETCVSQKKVNLAVNSKLFIEFLESKVLLAGDVGLNDAGELLIEGSSSDDSVVVTQERGTVSVDYAGTTTRYSGVRTIRFLGRDGNDLFVNHTSLPSVAYGNQGNDTLVGGRSSDNLFGGPGNDLLRGREGDDALHGDHGDDRLEGGEGDDDLRGWYGKDVLFGNEGDDYLSGYHGNDLIWAGDGDDVLKGHEGNDRLFGQDGNDRVYGWKGNDLLVGGNGEDYLSGWSGNDILVGDSGADVLRGHSGNDLLIGGKGNDELDGGSGRDVAIAGWTKYDGNFDALARILAADADSESLEQRGKRRWLEFREAKSDHSVFDRFGGLRQDAPFGWKKSD